MPDHDIAVSVRGLSKSYTIAHNAAKHTTLGEALVHTLKSLRGTRPVSEMETFWALRDVEFDIKKGDVVGIIGRNGAGKSTLLKVLSRITEPTTGQIDIYGRVGSLLEVGTGFHPELTGRENVYMNGAILGMSKAEIAKNFDAIVDFSGTEQFLDTPVKRYSSGMYVRLAFAVAAHLNPEILIVDEVLAVGDAEFQKKCLGKMQDVASTGRTILFVSHNLEVVRRLCTKGIFLENGCVSVGGSAQEALNAYVESSAKQAEYKISPPTEDNAPGCAYRLSLEDLDGAPLREVPAGQPWQVRVHFRINQALEDFVVGLGILTPHDTPLTTSWSRPRNLAPGEYEAVFRDEKVHLEPGNYPLLIGLSTGGRTFHYADKAGVLSISNISNFAEDIYVVHLNGCGTVLNPLDVDIRCIG